MRTTRAAAAATLISALLIGCSKTPETRGADAQPAVPAQAVPGTQAGGSGDTSVPPVAAVMVPPDAKPAEAASAGRTNSAMSPREESTAMPLPGQNNDHSAPLSTAKPAASSPR
jgi:hypothetical protein